MAAPRQKQIDTELEDEYWSLIEEYQDEFKGYADQYSEGEVDADEFKERMRQGITALFIALAVLGSGGDFDGSDEDDLDDLNFLLNDRLGLLDEFVLVLGEHTAAYNKWRAGLYAGGRHVFIRYMLPRDVWINMPYFPGESCLGDGWCQCWLETVYLEDSVEVYWYLGPTEHCSVCLAAEAESPYIFEA